MAKKPKSSTASEQVKTPSSPDGIKAIAVCASYGNKPENLLEIFHDLQHDIGYVPESVLPVIANALNLSRADVHGVITFYHDFKRAPTGRHIVKICRAEACQSMGTDKLCAHAEKSLNTELGGTTADGKVTIEQVFCLGNCALSPAVLIDDKLYGKVDAKRFDEIIANLGRETAA